MLLFKYASPTAAIAMLQEDEATVSLRFARPRTYNDPYELFLRPYPALQSEDERAFYDFFLGTVDQAPVTCFSKRPESVVMWAHYARDGCGICIAFDEESLVNHFNLAFIGDVEYSDSPASISSHFVNFALTTGKRRHTLRLLEVGRKAAYFMKRSDWAYERERRLVALPDALIPREDYWVAGIAWEAVRYVILGANVDANLRDLVKARTARANVPCLEFQVGRRTYDPFFTASDGTTCRWDGAAFESTLEVCRCCGEPATYLEDESCEWCRISEEARQSAPRRSMLTATLYYGIDQGIPLAFDGLERKGRWSSEVRRDLAPDAEPDAMTPKAPESPGE